MGMTLWIHTLDERGLSSDSDDHSLMHAYAEELDALSGELGVEKLSSFFDTTELDYSLSHDYDEDDEDEAGERGRGGDDDEVEEDEEAEDEDLDPETGAPYGIDDMRWFDSSVGLSTLVALRDAIEADEASLELEPDEREDLLAELEDCIEVLEETAGDGGKFHLAVVK